jgi:ketosteroid isomerase-like protein
LGIAFTASASMVACASLPARRADADLQRESQRVLAAEDAYVAAEVRRDEASLRRLVDDKFTYNAADGTTSGKDELIRGILRMDMTGQTVSERSVLLEGDVAVIMATTELRFGGADGPPRTSRLRYTAVYVKREGAWRMLALQMQPRSTR